MAALSAGRHKPMMMIRVIICRINSAIRPLVGCKAPLMQHFAVDCCIPFWGSFSRRDYAVETVPLFAAQTSQFSF